MTRTDRSDRLMVLPEGPRLLVGAGLDRVRWRLWTDPAATFPGVILDVDRAAAVVDLSSLAVVGLDVVTEHFEGHWR